MAATSNYEDLLSLFECPVCMTYMVPPIVSCDNGHCFCFDCSKHCESCPLCRSVRPTRAVKVEALVRKITFPCSNKPEGCTVKGDIVSMKQHEKGCRYSVRVCPLAQERGCTWTGPLGEIMRHFLEDHLENVNRTNSATFLLEGNDEYFFRVYWRLDEDTDRMTFSVDYYGHPVEGRFWFDVIFREVDTGEAVETRGHCCCCCENDGRVFSEVCVDMNEVRDLLGEGRIDIAVKLYDDECDYEEKS